MQILQISKNQSIYHCRYVTLYDVPIFRWRSLSKTTKLNLLVSLYEKVCIAFNFIHYFLLSLLFLIFLSFTLSFSLSFSLFLSLSFSLSFSLFLSLSSSLSLYFSLSLSLSKSSHLMQIYGFFRPELLRNRCFLK